MSGGQARRELPYWGWSGRGDSNPHDLRPKRSGLPLPYVPILLGPYTNLMAWGLTF